MTARIGETVFWIYNPFPGEKGYYWAKIVQDKSMHKFEDGEISPEHLEKSSIDPIQRDFCCRHEWKYMCNNSSKFRFNF